MISRMEKRILAIVLAFLMCVTTGYTGTVTANAAEFQDSEITEISEGVKNETTLDAGAKTAIYRFVPQETGTYHFYSVESGDTYGAIYDASQNLIKEASDDGNSGVDFSIETELTAGETYYLGVNYYLDVDSGKITWIVEKEETKATEDVSEAQTEAALEDSSEGAATVASAEEEASKWNCKLDTDGTGLVITGYTGEETDLVVPEELEYEGKKYPVTEIGEAAFGMSNASGTSGIKSLNSIKIPSTVKVIGDNAFHYNRTLASVDLSDATGLKTIGDGAFSDAKFTTIEFPENLETIGNYAFSGVQFTTLEFPENLKTIGSTAFACGWTNYGSLSRLTKIDFSRAKNLESIGRMAFANALITEVSFPEKLKTIEERAFADITSLTKVDFSNASSLEVIEKAAFKNCSIKEVAFPENLKEIEGEAFGVELNEVSELEKVDFSKATSLVRIGYEAFSSSSIRTVKLPKNIEEIANGAFSGNELLTEVDFSDAKKLEAISSDAFAWCPELKNINLEEATSLTTIASSAFQGIGTDFMAIPDSVEEIAEDTEYGSYTFSSADGGTFYLYGKVGSAAQQYANNSNGRVEFREVDGVYLKGSEKDAIKVGEDSYQLEVLWPRKESNSELKWKSSNPSVATVDSKGLVTKVKKGTVRITATRGDYSDSVRIRFQAAYNVSQDGKWYYRILSDKTIAICGYTGGDEEKVTIPETIDGQKVTRLQDFSVANWDNIKVLILPKTLTTIDSGVFMEYSGEIIIPDDNAISYIGKSTFGYNCSVYGPENFLFANYINASCENGYRLDNKLYIAGKGFQTANYDECIYQMEVEHIPSSLPEDTEITWENSDPEKVVIDSTENGRSAEAIKAKTDVYGTFTITASTGIYQDSIKVEFKPKVFNATEGGYLYIVLDAEQKTAALVGCNNTLSGGEPMEIPETVKGFNTDGESYTVTTIKNGAFSDVSWDDDDITVVIPDTVTEIEDQAFAKVDVVVGTKGTESERFVKRHGGQMIFCDRNQMKLNTDRAEVWMKKDSWRPSTYTLSVSYAYEGADLSNIKWESTAPEVASVGDGVVTLHKQGSTVITATCGGLKASCTVDVGYVEDGYRYKELNDGTVEFLGRRDNEYEGIPEYLGGKKVTVIGEGAVKTNSSIVIPDTVKAIKQNAFSAEYGNDTIMVSMPDSVTTIEAGAFGDNGNTYEFYGVCGSFAEKYAEKYDYIEFFEDQLILEGDLYETEEVSVGILAIGEKTELEIVHFPMDTDMDSDRLHGHLPIQKLFL